MDRKTLCIALLIAAAFSLYPARAAQTYVNIENRLTPEQMHDTGLDTLSPSQLETLNRLLGAETQQRVKAEKLNVDGKPSGTSYIGLDDRPIKSRLKGVISSWDVDTVFELENGQRWKVLKGSLKLRKPMQSPEILVVPGIAGRWFLQVDEDLPKARVYRID